MSELSVHSLGETALCCTLPAPLSLEQQQRIWQLAAGLADVDGVQELIPGMNNLTLPAPLSLEQQQRVWQLAAGLADMDGVQELIPGMNNLTLVFDPLRTKPAELEAAALALWAKPPRRQRPGKLVEIPVIYDGPDLGDVASHCGLSADEVVQRHTAAEYVVYFLGFQPGFGYLGGLDEALHTPRRAEPRVSVPAGSVGIGGAQTGIYPLASPGGWQLIGRTDMPLFDPQAEPPTLLAPGDRLRFVAVPE